jgi:hypothetical protein
MNSDPVQSRPMLVSSRAVIRASHLARNLAGRSVPS